MPFVALGCKTMDCTHGKDHAISIKIKGKSKKKKKNGGQVSITEIYNWIFTSLSQIFRGEVLFSYHPSFSLLLEIICMRKVWNKSVNSFKMLNRIFAERQK